MTPYEEAHLFVSAIRILYHQKKRAPAIDAVCSLLNISNEAGHSICRKLESHNIIEIFEDPFSIKLGVADHLKIEEFPKEEIAQNGLAKELEQFMSKKEDMNKKVESIQAELEAKKRNMFKDIEEQFKKQMKE